MLHFTIYVFWCEFKIWWNHMWMLLVTSSYPTACKAATQCCGLGCNALNSSGLNKAGENTPPLNQEEHQVSGWRGDIYRLFYLPCSIWGGGGLGEEWGRGKADTSCIYYIKVLMFADILRNLSCRILKDIAPSEHLEAPWDIETGYV